MSTEITLKPCPRCGRLPYKMLNGDGAFTPACACSKRELQAEIDCLKAELADAKESVAEAQQCYEFLDHQNNDLRNELAEAKKVPDGMRLVRTTDIVDAKHWLEKATMWNGQGWDYNPLHPMFYRPAIELLDAMINASPEYKEEGK